MVTYQSRLLLSFIAIEIEISLKCSYTYLGTYLYTIYVLGKVREYYTSFLYPSFFFIAFYFLLNELF